VTFFFEIDADGWVTRHVELAGSERRPCVAASLVEWMLELEAGTIQSYQARYGVLAEKPVTEWEDFPHVNLSRDDFEAVWRSARLFLAETK
jgi:hypothetical protein